MSKVYYIRTQNVLQAVIPAVTGLTVTGVTAFTASFAWNPVPGAVEYIVYVTGGLTTSFNSFVTTLTLSSLNPLTSYQVAVSAVLQSGEGPKSAPVTATTVSGSSVPSQVTGLTATTVSYTQINLAWSANPTATSYNIYQNGVKVVSGIASASYNVSGLTGSTTYSFQVSGTNAQGEGALSSTASATTLVAPPGQVTGLTGSVSQNSITLNWNPTPNATNYNIYQVGITAPVVSGVTGTNFTLSALNFGQTYTYDVAAANSSGIGPVSATVTENTPNQSGQGGGGAASTGLLATLQNLNVGNNNRILAGQHTDYYDASATTPWASFSAGSTNAANANINGQGVPLIGIAVQGPPNGGNTQQSQGSFVSLANSIIATGCIPFVSMWPGNPATNVFGGGADASNLTNPFPSLLTIGSTFYNNWTTNLNAIATLLNQINGQYIFRPFVEINLNGSWWYDNRNATTSQQAQLWTLTRNYLISKGVGSNCLWNFNVNDGTGNYTGAFVAGQVDVVSFDSYTDNVGTNAKNSGCYAALVATGCPVMISETGNGNFQNSDGYSYYNTLQDIKTNTPNVVGIVQFCQSWTLANNSGATAYLNDTWITTKADYLLEPPVQALAAGYDLLTFNSTQISSTPGNWYPWTFYGGTTPGGNYTQNADGSITLQNNANSGATLVTCTKTNSAQGWTGWAPGGGMYFEFVASLTNPTQGSTGPAALWFLDIEHTSQGSAYNGSFWPSNPQIQNQDGSGGYDDYIEWDLMEYDNAAQPGTKVGFNANGSNWVDHKGQNALNWGQSNFWPQQFNGSSGSVPVPPTTDFTQKHTWGFLWVPATGTGQTTTTQGYTAIFFDNVQVAGGIATAPANPTDNKGRPSYWNYHDPTDIVHYPTPTQAGAPTIPNQGMPGNPGVPPTYGDVCMSIMDFRHMMPIVGGGNTQHMTVYSARCWQASAAKNLQY